MKWGSRALSPSLSLSLLLPPPSPPLTGEREKGKEGGGGGARADKWREPQRARVKVRAHHNVARTSFLCLSEGGCVDRMKSQMKKNKTNQGNINLALFPYNGTKMMHLLHRVLNMFTV